MSTQEAALERWRETWELAGASPPVRAFDDLLARYGEPHRAYHDLEHVVSCLRHAADVRARLTSPAEVELALWYHDAVYDPHRGDNEEASAQLATDRLGTVLAAKAVAAIRDLILATRHLAVPEGPEGDDARFLVDIDLAILGETPEAFDAYETAVRREYRWVPAPLFRRKRREILQGFLDRPRIYQTDHFHALLEAAARDNLARSIARLS